MSGAVVDDLFPELEGAGLAGSPAPNAPSPIASSSRTPDVMPFGSTSPVEREIPIGPDEDDAGDDVGNLFGDDDEDDKPPTPRTDRGLSSTATPESPQSQGERSGGSPHPLEYAEEEEVHEFNETWANLPLPKWPHLEPTDGKVWHLRLPAYMNIESKPFDPDYYRETLADDPIDAKTDPRAAKNRMLAVKNTIRWKWVTGPDGEPMQQSNARLLRWSDGSMSLQLGNDMFNVAASHGATLARPTDIKPSNQESSQPSSQSRSSTSSTTFLCVAATGERVLVTETAIAGQLSLVPTSMTSKTHIELVKHVGQQHVKHSRMKILDDVHDAAKVNELLLKAEGKDKTAKPRVKRTGASQSSTRRPRRGFSDDSGSERGYGSKRMPVGPGDYEEDDGFVVADEDEDEMEQEETEDEDDAAWGSSRNSKIKSKGKGKKKGGGRKRKSSESLDEMEEADRRIERSERERKRAKRNQGSGASSSQAKSRDYVDTDDEDGGGNGDADRDAEGEVDEGEQDMDMDVESEED